MCDRRINVTQPRSEADIILFMVETNRSKRSTEQIMLWILFYITIVTSAIIFTPCYSDALQHPFEKLCYNVYIYIAIN